VREVRPTVKVGDTLSFQLLQRSRGSIIPEARCTALSLVGATTSTALSLVGATTSTAGGDEVAGRLNSRLRNAPSPLPALSAAGGAVPAHLFGLGANVFSKFSVIHDATLLWEEAAHELAGYAALVRQHSQLYDECVNKHTIVTA
jgi:hypothetical protein